MGNEKPPKDESEDNVVGFEKFREKQQRNNVDELNPVAHEKLHEELMDEAMDAVAKYTSLLSANIALGNDASLEVLKNKIVKLEEDIQKVGVMESSVQRHKAKKEMEKLLSTYRIRYGNIHKAQVKAFELVERVLTMNQAMRQRFGDEYADKYWEESSVGEDFWENIKNEILVNSFLDEEE